MVSFIFRTDKWWWDPPYQHKTADEEQISKVVERLAAVPKEVPKSQPIPPRIVQTAPAQAKRNPVSGFAWTKRKINNRSIWSPKISDNHKLCNIVERQETD